MMKLEDITDLNDALLFSSDETAASNALYVALDEFDNILFKKSKNLKILFIISDNIYLLSPAESKAITEEDRKIYNSDESLAYFEAALGRAFSFLSLAEKLDVIYQLTLLSTIRIIFRDTEYSYKLDKYEEAEIQYVGVHPDFTK